MSESSNVTLMNTVLAFEAKALGRKMERKAKRLEEAAKRKVFSFDVVESNSDNIRGDMCSLILNGKPQNLTLDDWLDEIERRGGRKSATMKRWLEQKVQVPQTMSCYDTLHALGLDYYIGRRQ